MSGRKTKRQSGAFYKRKRSKKEEEKQKLKGALQRFLEKPESLSSTSTPIDNENSTYDSDCDERHYFSTVRLEALKTSSLDRECEGKLGKKQEECRNDILNTVIYKDPANWPTVLTDQIKNIIIEKGPVDMVDTFSFPPDEKSRKFSSKHFYLILSTGERIKRTWLVYSISEDKIYCFCCKLFNAINTKFVTGYNDWKNVSYAITHHEKNVFHIKSFSDWSELLKRKRLTKTIDADCERIFQQECRHWRDVFQRLSEVIFTLAELNLPFRGKSDTLFEKNNGVFLKFIECLGLYDPVLKEHIRRITSKETHIHYLGKNIQNELIGLLAQKTKNKIIEMAKKAEFFSVIMDTTPDISHNEQLTLIIRFVNTESNDTHLVEEHFIGFIEVNDTTGFRLASIFLDEIQALGLDIYNCRGQGYDNGANMKGKNNGLQKHILNINPRAFFVPCSCHSVNLVLNDAAESNLEMVNFFGTVQNLYKFFSTSTRRWSILLKHVPNLTLKPVCSTRWESRINAIRPIRFQLGEIYDALIEITEDTSLAGSHGNKTKAEAISLVQKLKDYQFICTAVIWYNVLLEVNRVNLLLQSPKCSICTAAETIGQVVNNLKKLRNDEEYEQMFVTTRELAHTIDLEPKFSEVRIRRRKRHFDYEASDDSMEDPSQKFKVNVYFNLLDIAIQSTEERFQQLSTYSNKFGFIHNISELSNWKKEDILKHCMDLEGTLTYNNKKDVDGIHLSEEITFISKVLKPTDTANDILKYIVKNELIIIYPNLYIALKIILTIPVSVALSLSLSSGERSFSRLKLIKTYLRSTMTQHRLSGLSILSIENDVARSIDKEDILREFASVKARKKL